MDFKKVFIALKNAIRSALNEKISIASGLSIVLSFVLLILISLLLMVDSKEELRRGELSGYVNYLSTHDYNGTYDYMRNCFSCRTLNESLILYKKVEVWDGLAEVGVIICPYKDTLAFVHFSFDTESRIIYYRAFYGFGLDASPFTLNENETVNRGLITLCGQYAAILDREIGEDKEGYIESCQKFQSRKIWDEYKRIDSEVALCSSNSEVQELRGFVFWRKSKMGRVPVHNSE